jgi:hypothetical protein
MALSRVVNDDALLATLDRLIPLANQPRLAPDHPAPATGTAPLPELKK